MMSFQMIEPPKIHRLTIRIPQFDEFEIQTPDGLSSENCVRPSPDSPFQISSQNESLIVHYDYDYDCGIAPVSNCSPTLDELVEKLYGENVRKLVDDIEDLYCSEFCDMDDVFQTPKKEFRKKSTIQKEGKEDFEEHKEHKEQEDQEEENQTNQIYECDICTSKCHSFTCPICVLEYWSDF